MFKPLGSEQPGKRGNFLIGCAAKRQFLADHPNSDWDFVEAASAEMDGRALYLYQAEEYLISHGVISPAAKQAAWSSRDGALCRLHRDQEEMVSVRDLDGVAGEIDCIECNGTGIWTNLPPDNHPIKCTTCKATGKMLISV